MSRVVIAFLITPLLASIALAITSFQGAWLFFGPIFTYPLMLVVGLPIFLLFRKLKWLQWWHAAGMGLLVALAFTWLWDKSGNPYHIEIYGPSEAGLWLTMGYMTATLFWFIGLYRNEDYPYVLSRLALISIFPLALLIGGTAYLQYAVSTHNVKGTITALLEPVHKKPMVRIDLGDGKTVDARLMCYHGYHVGDQVYLDHRRLSWPIGEGYWVVGAPIQGAKFDPEAFLKEQQACYDEAYGNGES